VKRGATWIVVSSMVLATPAHADPTKDQCINANETGQAQRASGKLRDAADTLTLCATRSCPAPVRNDCSQRLDEVQKALPTVVFAVHTPRGDDLTAVRVRMDGVPLVASLDGSAVAVDPGPHTFAFDAAGFTPAEQPTLIREGEKERSVVVTLRTAEEAGHAGPSARRVTAVVAMGVGVVAVGVGGILGLEAKSEFDSAEKETGDPRHADSLTAFRTGNVATVVLAAGGVLALGGAVLWLTTPADSTRVGTNGSQVLVQGHFW
jgi:hypothetical protein